MEDSQSVDVIAAVVRHWSVTVHPAQDMLEACERMARQEYDLAFIEHDGDIDGLLLLARMRRLGHRTSVVLISSQDHRELRGPGILRVMRKPVELDGVWSVMARHLTGDLPGS